MCFRRAFHLKYFAQRFVFHPSARIAGIHHFPVEHHLVVHAPVTDIAIVRNRKRRHALFALLFQGGPQISGIFRIH